MEEDWGVCNDKVEYTLPGAELVVYPQFLSREAADCWYDIFSVYPFQQGKVRNGVEKRLSCYYSTLTDDKGILLPYYYAGKQNTPNSFTDELTIMMKLVETATGAKYNSCLINYYPDGRSVIGYHSDSEKSLVPESMIASLSLGAPRTFDIKSNKNDGAKTSILMTHGSMLTMAGKMQQNYKHQLRANAKIIEPRINLTFRLSK